MHGRVEGARARCAVPGCTARGEYKARSEAANFDGPGSWRFLCLDHVREHNSKYNYFEGMSAEEISEAQSPLRGWERPSRRFATNGADPPPAWSDFADPLDAISARFGGARRRAKPSRFSRTERRALSVLGLGEDAGPPRGAPALFAAGPPLSSRPERRRPPPRGQARAK